MPDVILITGASRGLGFWLARFYLEKGETVIALNKSKSTEFNDLIKKYYGRAFQFIADVSNEKSILNAFRAFKNKFDRIDIIINNAGIHPEPSAHEWQPVPDLANIDLNIINKNIAVNTYGPLLIIKNFLHFLKKGNKKLIINISSEAGSIADSFRKDEFGYCMSKTALNMQSKILQNRLKEFSIKVLAIDPGWMKTNMGGADAKLSPEDSAKDIISQIQKQWKLDDPIYIDHKGNPLNW